MRILTWNLERRKTTTPFGKLSIRHLFSQNPDIMALSETRTTFPAQEGYSIWAQHPKGHFADDERKILLWSKSSWEDVDDFGSTNLPIGRFISGRTTIAGQTVRVIGVCIPYHMADVTYGSKDKKPWEQHKLFLDLFPEIVSRYTGPVIIAGDFNQTYPRIKYGNREAAMKMKAAFSDFDIVTKGIINGLDKAGIDHIAISKELSAQSVWGWKNIVDGNRLSDHDGAGCELSI